MVDWINLSEILLSIWNGFVFFVKLLLIAIFGYIFGFLFEAVSKKTIRSMLGARRVKEVGVKSAALEAGVEIGVVEIIGEFIKYAIYLATIIIIFDQLGITMARDMLIGVWNYLPNIVATFLILVIGAMVAEVVGNVARLSARSLGLDDLFKEAGNALLPSSLISMVFKYFIYLISITIALTQLGFQTLLLTIIVGSAAIIITLFVFSLIAFGLKDMMPNVLAGVFIRSSGFVKLGQKIEIKEFKGKVVKIGLLATVIQNKDEILKIPNSKIIEGVKTFK